MSFINDEALFFGAALDFLGADFFGTDFFGTDFLAEDVLGEDVLGEDVLGADFLGAVFLGADDLPALVPVEAFFFGTGVSFALVVDFALVELALFFTAMVMKPFAKRGNLVHPSETEIARQPGHVYESSKRVRVIVKRIFKNT
ncbi:MAG: hypothetical protein NVSMB9_02370 [Isosphaeraceae bacterium]